MSVAIHLKGSLPSVRLEIKKLPSTLETVTLLPPVIPRYSKTLPLPTKNLLVTGVVEVAVPPLTRPKMPLMSVVRETKGEEVKRPALAEDFTKPEPRLVKVEEPVTRMPPARVEKPVTARVPEELRAVAILRLVPVELVKFKVCKEVLPVTARVPEAFKAVVDLKVPELVPLVKFRV